MSESSSLRRRANALGIATSYTEIGGRRRQVPAETLRAVVDVLGRSRAALAQPETRRRDELAPTVVASFAPAPVRVPLDGAFGTIEWTIVGEGREYSGRAAANELATGGGKPALILPPLAPGYYRLRLAAGKRHAESLLIRAPARAWLPSALEHGRGYGLAVQLYELIGLGSMGVGDFGDLAGLAEAAGRMGTSTLGVNPLHALFLSDPGRASPYSPSSRFALNPLYLDVRRLPGFDVRAKAKAESPAFCARVAALNAQPLVDYPGAARAKLALARLAFEDFRGAGTDAGFARFCHEATGADLWARHEAIAVEHGADWRAWPARLREPGGAAVERYVAEHSERVDFHLWLQWQAERQLEHAARAAREAEMGVGLYRDLALGADPGGAECWAGRADYAAGLAIGAPPDPFNPRGQNWGFPPFDPQRLSANEFAPFITLLRANMRHAGALRIDHVLGLKRLFVIPDGAKPEAGAYLGYPFETLLAIVVLESVRAKCLVIGEDLGTVPRGLRAALARRGIFSLRLLYFEHDRAGRPRAPGDWPRDAVAAVGTHDMAPLAGWWREDDLARLDRLGLWPDEAASVEARRSRAAERNAFARALQATAEDNAVPAAAAYGHLARTASRLAMIQPEDALGIEAPVNQPGTTDEEPNWRRRRLPPWPEWLADPRFVAIIRAVQAQRGGPPARPETPLVATYRLQLNRQFGFRDAAHIVPYLAGLGASHLYLSPILAATPGSMHGYDMVNPARFDAERGGEAGFAELASICADDGLGLIADFVPNHMGANAANPWWMDLLEWGLASRYARAFDVDWASAGNRIVLPLLGMSLARTIARGEVGLEFDPGGGFAATYYEHRLPLAPMSLSPLLVAAARECECTETPARLFSRRSRENGNPVIAKTRIPASAGMTEISKTCAGKRLRRLARCSHALGKCAEAERRAAGLTLKAELAALAEDSRIRAAIGFAVEKFAADRNRCARLLARQHWRLVYWRRGIEEVNYRRFFDVASLAAMRTEQPAVFAAAHVRIRGLLAARALAGLRLDHVDGLAAPTRYLDALAELVAAHGDDAPLWVEKILGVSEALPDWPVAGTTGYEFLNDVTRLFMSPVGARRLRALWRTRAPDAGSFAATLTRAKREAVRNLLAPMLERVTDSLAARAPVPRRVLRRALVEGLVALPVYRLYPDARAGLIPAEHNGLARMTAAASRVNHAAGTWLAEIIERSFAEETGGPDLPATLADGLTRLWQLAAAATAKGLEDTAFYRDFALLALNEVGGDPRVVAFTPVEFHRRMEARARAWPTALSASATHDNKRGEDARLRLAMLSHRAIEWRELIPRLDAATRGFAAEALYPGDTYFVWQTLAAILPPRGAEDGEAREVLAERLREYLVKALREGKQRSSWLAPNKGYEAAVSDYATALLDPVRGQAFQREFIPFAATLARDGALASLAALALQCTAPGVPDFYQGSELWDLSLVDPDNRRPVDYGRRERALAELTPWIAGRVGGRAKFVRGLLAAWPDGRIKLYMLASLLRLRRRHPALFAQGSYQPLPIQGERADDALAFRRAHRGKEVVVLVARFAPALVDGERCALAASAWGDTRCSLDGAESRPWRELLTGRNIAGSELRLAELLSPLPAAILEPGL